MRQETKIVNIYNYEDLLLEENANILKNVLSKFEVYTDDIEECAKESVEKFHKFFQFSEKTSKYSWLTWNLCTYEDVEDLKGIELQEWLLANYSLKKVLECCPLTGVCYDETLLTPFRNFMCNKDYSKEVFRQTRLANLVAQSFEDLVNEIISEKDYRHTKNAILENIEANEYEFYENGDLI